MGHLIYPNNISVSYDEMAESPVENVGASKQEAMRVLKCSWADRLKLSAELVGYTQDFGLDTIHYLPHQYQYLGLYHLYATDVKIKPFTNKMINTASSEWATYEKAILTVTYSVPEYEFPVENEETYVTESLEPATEFMTLSHNNLFWDASGAEPIDPADAPSKLVRMTAWVYTLHALQALPSAVFTLPGRVNQDDVYSWSLNKWFAWETLLCGDPSLSREKTSTGTTAWSVTFRFIHRNAGSFGSPRGWNVFPKPKDADADGHISYMSVKTADGDDILVYEPDDFGALII